MSRNRSYGFMAYCTLGLLCVMYLMCQTAIWLETTAYNPLEKIFSGSYIFVDNQNK